MFRLVHSPPRKSPASTFRRCPSVSIFPAQKIRLSTHPATRTDTTLHPSPPQSSASLRPTDRARSCICCPDPNTPPSPPFSHLATMPVRLLPGGMGSRNISLSSANSSPTTTPTPSPPPPPVDPHSLPIPTAPTFFPVLPPAPRISHCLP